MTYAPSKTSDQPRHLCTAVHSYQKLALWLTSSSGEWIRSDWTDAQTDWLHMPFCRFRYAPVYLYRRSHIWACAWQNLKKSHVRPVKTQICLCICPVWSESLQSAWWSIGSLATHWAHAQWRLWSDWPDAQADLSFHWAHINLLVLSCYSSFFL